ncbi:CDP-glucose 4,6-dehydratase [Chitinophaga sp. XS-30]|uniref:CDP-glucose 4,6-dehydratase n=1 Tax=Chitinophaga sp. XS-30 TaxID=2604421 RepID=UPI0011DD7FB3|nr:CDP-glucose 4,6-dehydratase [Chitinophaga sp. XS-30]QEH39751.1 CDP-glucose 4,6-dehydratase [Chitinophaga sp. XS-30]
MKEKIDIITNAFAGKRVFVTGHTGFKGSWMVAWLHLLGANVRGYALAPQGKDALYSQIDGDKLCDSVIADIRDEAKLKQELVSFRPDFVFHLAAQPLVRKSYEIPLETFDTNVMGTAYVLNAVRDVSTPCTAVIITTDKVYENREWLYPYRENEPLGGYDPYSASKAACEIVCGAYRNSYFNPSDYVTHKKSISTARAGNVIGGGDWAENRIIPDLIRAFSKKQELSVRNPEAIRPWQHVMEPLFGYLLLAALMAKEPIRFAAAWNFGPEAKDTLTVKDLVEIAIKQWGSGQMRVENPKHQYHEANLLKLDISMAVGMLGWTPRYSAEKSIEVTINWYKDYLDGKNAFDIMKDQIKAYTS